MLLAFDEFVLDTRAFELTFRGEPRTLRKRPLDLLIYLVLHRDRVVTKHELLSKVWEGVRVTENALVQAIGSLRAALGSCGERAIESVRGRGYRFMLPVVPIEATFGAGTVIRIAAHDGEPLGTFRGLLRAYATLRPQARVHGLPLTIGAAAATTKEAMITLVLELFASIEEKPAILLIDHVERADLESLLLFVALAGRPRGILSIRATCTWADVPSDGAVASLLRLGMSGGAIHSSQDCAGAAAANGREVIREPSHVAHRPEPLRVVG